MGLIGNRLRRRMALVFGGLLLILGTRFVGGQALESPVPSVAPAAVSSVASLPAGLSVPAAGGAGEASPTVTVGVYLQNVNDVDMKTSVYLVDFYLWFRWKGNIDPTKSFEFPNLVDSWSLTKEPIYPDPEVLEDGSQYQIFHVQGKFNRKFDLRSYPLDEQELVVMVEDNRHPLKRVRFAPDLRSSGFSPRITLPGWDIRKFEVRPLLGEYETDFGHPEVGQRESYSRIEFGLQIARPRAAYLFRLLLPIAVVLLSCFSVFFLSPAFADARVDVPIAVLLTTVALHLTVSSDLPQVGYIRLIDKVYNFAYLVIFVSLVESIAAIHWREKGEGERAMRLDRWAAMVLPPLTLTGMLLVMWLG